MGRGSKSQLSLHLDMSLATKRCDKSITPDARVCSSCASSNISVATKENESTASTGGNAMDEGGTVAQWIIEPGSQAGPQIVEHLSNNPEQWGELAQMPQRYREQALARMEGVLLTQQQFAQQMAQQRPSWQQDRRMTKAPPPIRPPRGGANPPSDIHQLASRGESADDYVKARKAMEKKLDD
jgi:hypothetical protein